MRKDIEKLLPKAMSAVTAFLFNDKSEVLQEYDGYAASLGAAIRTSGLIPALAFYTDISRSEGTARRYRLLQAIAVCLDFTVIKDDKDHRQLLLNQVIEAVYGQGITQPEKLLDKENQINYFARPLGTINRKALRSWTEMISNASIALKLAMRNFPHSDDKTKAHES